MKQLELKRNTSRMAPNITGKRKPPRPPIIPTIPDTTPMESGNSSPIYLKVEAIPHANATPNTNNNPVKTHQGNMMEKPTGPSIVCMISSVFGYERMKRQIHATHSTHHVTSWAPNRSASHPPSARNPPPGNEKQAARREACVSVNPYSLLK